MDESRKENKSKDDSIYENEEIEEEAIENENKEENIQLMDIESSEEEGNILPVVS